MKRIPNLDLFRFIAISSVLYYHLSQRFLFDFYADKRFIDIGKYGVELFFTLSGFLIGSIYYKNSKSVNLFKFWLQRFIRTYPPYLVAFAIYFLLAYIAKKERFDLGYLVFFQNYYYVMPLFKISWSLCVEEHFYLIFPIIMLVLDRWIQNKKITFLFWIVICLLPTCFRYEFGNYKSTEWGFYITASIFRFDGIAIGCFIAFIVNKYDLTKWRSSHKNNIILSIIALALAFWLTGPQSLLKYSVGYLFLVVNIGLLMLSLYFSPDLILSKTSVIKGMAAMAYSLYLTHALLINFFEVLQNKFKVQGYFIAPVCLAFIIIIGKIYYIFIERKSIDLRNKLLGHR